jgi:hypothetical protein
LFVSVGQSGQEEDASGPAGVLLHPSCSWEEQSDLGVPEERWGLARQDYTTVVLPHQPESYIGFRHLPPPC